MLLLAVTVDLQSTIGKRHSEHPKAGASFSSQQCRLERNYDTECKTTEVSLSFFLPLRHLLHPPVYLGSNDTMFPTFYVRYITLTVALSLSSFVLTTVMDAGKSMSLE